MDFFRRKEEPKMREAEAERKNTIEEEQEQEQEQEKPKEQTKEESNAQIEEEKKVKMELELRELQRSEEPICEGGDAKKIETIRPWNNYTIVLEEGKNDIEIYDENAKPLENFKFPLSDKKVVMYWWSNNVNKSGGKKYISEDRKFANSNSVVMINKLPVGLRAFARKYLDNKKYGQDYAKLIPEKLVVSDIIVLSDKYIVATTPEGAFFTYVTKNEQGITMSPKGWKRLEQEDQMPTDVTEAMEKIVKGKGDYKEINQEYYAIATDVGINIFKNSDTSAPVFSESIPSVERNIIIDSANPNILYYCPSINPKSIQRLDLSGEANNWKSVSADFKENYESVHNFQLDLSGNFFIFYSREDLVVVSKDTLEEVKRVPNLTNVIFDSEGRIRAVDKDGHLVIYEANFNEIAEEFDKRRAANLAERIDIKNIFDFQAEKTETQKGGKNFEHLESLRTKCQKEFNDVLSKITTEEGIFQVRQGLNKFQIVLRQQGLKPNEVSYIIEGLEEPIIVKEKEFANKSVRNVLVSVRAKLEGGLSISSVSDARVEMEKVKFAEALLEEDLRKEVREVAQDLEKRSLELFQKRGGEIIKDVGGIIERTRKDLEGYTSKAQMDDWMEFRYPQLKSNLGFLAKDVPLEAEEAYKAITGARAELQKIAEQFEEKFKQEYAKVREKAAERTGAAVDMLESDIEGLIDRLRNKGFTERRSAEQYLESSVARKALEEEIAGLASVNPDAAKELGRNLKVRISNTLTEIERGAFMQVVETGQQMIMFGETPFPKWEARIKEKGERKVDLTFNEDVKSHGPGVKSSEILGDVAVNIKTSTGKAENVRLYEGWKNENEWRFGLLSYRGEEIPPSYITAKEYKDIKKEYSNWSRGEKSDLQKELQEKRDALKEIYAERKKIGKRDTAADEIWKDEYKEKLKEYATFVAEHHIPLLKRIEKIKNEPDIEYTNGKGFVPEWQNHWVNDPQTEKYLEEMAKTFKMQLDLQEGILNLKGHAGTGKDVLMKMFCALTHRPYFGIDCTKWTTEFELSEDIMLESKDGASQTIKVPSAVLNGITTPGAMVYFNEFNAMTEQAQMFLHALTDEKRSLTLKTSSGRVVRAIKDVLLACSMNPGYRGTTEPQSATRRRMVSMEIDYPPLTRKPDEGDTNPNLPYDASEALRIARGVDSLADITYEASIERNEFVKMWDKYVNGIENGASEPTQIQKFDMDTTLALVQFANILRENFMRYSEKGSSARNALPVIHPISGSELRRCAYWLSEMTPEEKVTANPEAVARDLINDWFLSNIDVKEDAEKIRNAMKTWTSKKRVRI